VRPDAHRLFAALEATWPPLRRHACGPFTLREGDGGGQRVSAATVAGAFSEADLDRALAGIAGLRQPPIFQIGPGADALDAALAVRGWLEHDPVTLWLAAVGGLAVPPPPASFYRVWPPLALQREIWAAGGIGPARLRVMERAADPRTAFLGRVGDHAAGTAFVAVSSGIAFLHALEVAPERRRQGAARHLVQAAAVWARDQGADWLGLAVTRANEPANRLYASLGMQIVARYHYRIPPGSGAP
jgi:GNAT superfamily N-acetyltransferase